MKEKSVISVILDYIFMFSIIGLTVILWLLTISLIL